MAKVRFEIDIIVFDSLREIIDRDTAATAAAFEKAEVEAKMLRDRDMSTVDNTAILRDLQKRKFKRDQVVYALGLS